MSGALEWRFGGFLSALHPVVAWGVLSLFAVAGLLLVVWLYRRTLRGLTPPARWLLTVFRVAVVLLVLLCLANPVRVERANPDVSERDALAVVVDRSASMSEPDYRGTTRLADAARTWKYHARGALAVFPKLLYQRFDLAPGPATSFDDALKSGEAGSETHLYSSLRAALASTPAAIVCLTDGLDTTGEKADELVDESLRRGVPLYFITGNNRSRASESFCIRAINVPLKTMRQTQFTATALIQAGAAGAGELPVELWSGDTKLAEASLPLRAGLNTLAWPVQVKSGEPRVLPLEFRVGSGASRETVSCTTRVVAHTRIEVLCYQGAFQWGYRFLLAALQSDPSFQMTAIVNPALRLQAAASPASESTLEDLPEDAGALKRFQVVVLAHVFADQLSLKQQNALADYAKGGGSVLFVAPDSAAAKRFAGTPLEQMLPIVFERPKPESPEALATRQFQQHMDAIGGANNAQDTLFANEALRQQDRAKLMPFAVPDGKTPGSKIFEPGPNAPQFTDYAEVSGVKAGAEILAVHPSERVPGTNDRRVLVARQQFGEGFTAALTTDLLWRWKLSLPSTSHTAEVFWQQFLLSLAQPVAGQGLRLVKTGDAAAVGHPVTIQVDDPEHSQPELVSVSPEGERKPLSLEPAVNGTTLASFIPDSAGRWEVLAANAAGDRAGITLSVTRRARSMETSNLPPDLVGLRRIAEATGGALIDGGTPVFHRREAASDGEPSKPMPVWNSTWLLGLLLGVYGAELVTRRLFRLL